MDLSTIIARHYPLILSVVICLFVLPRIFRKGTNPNRKRRSRVRIAGAFLGNALMPLQAIIHPHTKHLVVESLNDHADGDQDADPADPMLHLQRQLKRIRNGEELDRITTLLR